jgi:hypothetical protein
MTYLRTNDPSRPKAWIVSRGSNYAVPAGFVLVGPPLHFTGLKQCAPSATFSAASWRPEVAAQVHSCVMVSSVGLTVTTAGRMDPGDAFLLRKLALDGGRVVGFTVRQRWQGEVWVWPLGII